MYLERLELKNTGPIHQASIDFRLNDDLTPKPIIFVGQNGSGKSVATAHIVNALIDAHGTVFEDSDVEQGRVFKLRSPTYIRHGKQYSTGEVFFGNDFSVHEAQLSRQKNQFVEPFPTYSKWNEIPDHENSHYTSNFAQSSAELREILNSQTHIFFPPNRFEEPAWLNEESLRNKANYASLKNFAGISNRPVVNYAPMRDLQNWLLDLIYDSYALERRLTPKLAAAANGQQVEPQIVEVRKGQASRILDQVGEFLKTLLGKQGVLQWSVGARNRRQIGVIVNGEVVTSNLFQLSTGQAVLLDLFLAIIRDFDLGRAPLNQLNEIKGIVVVDEIDLHLHTDLQHDLLPELIALFPKVQFILTTHSPLFLIGMEKRFGTEGFQLFELPAGQEIEVERFSEFEAAYKHMQDSARFQDDMKNRVEESQKPLLYLEGTTDFSYLTKAAEHLGKLDLFQRFELVDADGYSNMDKIWKAYSGHLSSSLREIGILLYDCDANRDARNSAKLFRRTLPAQEHKIGSGIENLFSDATMLKAIEHKADFVDVTDAHSKKVRGCTIEVPETWSVNKDEKRNLCTWICDNGTADDFESFSLVFDILEEVLNIDEEVAA